MVTPYDIKEFNLHDIIPDKLDITTKITTCMLNVPQHTHSYYEIFYIVNGTLTQNINGNEQTLTEGDCMLLTPNDKHSLHSNGFSVHRDILISKELFENEIFLLIPFSNDIKNCLEQLNNAVHFSLNEIIELENLAQKFNMSTPILQKRAIAITLLLQILTKMLNPNDLLTLNPNDLLTKNKSIVNIIIDHLNTLPYIQGGIPYLVKNLKYSESYLRHKFKKETGLSLSLYIKNLRLNYIVYYLKNSNYSLRQIAEIVGIESLPYLNKIFKEKYSIPPIAYRKLYSKKQDLSSD